MKIFSSCCELRNNWIRLLLNDPDGWSGTRFQHTKWRFSYAGKTYNIISPHTSCCLFTFSSTDVSLFHMVTQYYCIFLCLPCRANYYRKLYSKYITTGHQFFCASQRCNTVGWFPTFLCRSAIPEKKPWKPVPFLYNSSFSPPSPPAFRRRRFLFLWRLQQKARRGFWGFFYLFILPFCLFIQEMLFCHSFSALIKS